MQPIQVRLIDTKFNNLELGRTELTLAELLGGSHGYKEAPLKKSNFTTGHLSMRCFRADEETNYLKMGIGCKELANFGIMNSMDVMYKIFRPKLTVKQLVSYKEKKFPLSEITEWEPVVARIEGKASGNCKFASIAVGAQALCNQLWDMDLRVP